MHFKITRRLPLSMLFGLVFAGIGTAAPVDQHANEDEHLVLIAESALHGIGEPVVGREADGAATAAPAPSGSSARDHYSVDAEAASRISERSAHSAIVNGAASSSQGQDAGMLQTWTAVSAHQLDDMRGGFDTSLNLMLSFGIERAVYLNGALVTTTSFNLPALGTPLHADASSTAIPAGSVALIQNGPGNTFVRTPDAAFLAATVIQNTLSNQTFQSLTTVNASSNSLQILRSSGFQSMLQDGIGRVTVPH